MYTKADKRKDDEHLDYVLNVQHFDELPGGTLGSCVWWIVETLKILIVRLRRLENGDAPPD